VPVWYVGVINTDDTEATTIPEGVGSQRDRFLSQSMRWFLVREHADKALLCEHLWDGLPAFIRLAATQKLNFDDALVEKQTIINADGFTQRLYSYSRNVDGQPDLMTTGRHAPITSDWQKSLASLGGYGDDPPRYLDTRIHAQGRSINARVFSQVGRSWADGGGYLVICSPDPNEESAYIEINPSGGESNRMIPVSKNRLPDIYQQLLPRAYFREIDSVIEDRGSLREIRKTFAVTNTDHGMTGVQLTTTIPDIPTRLTQLQNTAVLKFADGSEQTLLPFFQHFVGFDILYF
jgi:hypothetical protein